MQTILEIRSGAVVHRIQVDQISSIALHETGNYVGVYMKSMDFLKLSVR